MTLKIVRKITTTLEGKKYKNYYLCNDDESVIIPIEVKLFRDKENGYIKNSKDLVKLDLLWQITNNNDYIK